MHCYGGDSTLVRYQLVRSSLGFLSFSCHKISGNETTDNRMCLMFCDLNAGLMGIKESWVQVGHKASNQPREIKDFTTGQRPSGPVNQISLPFAQHSPKWIKVFWYCLTVGNMWEHYINMLDTIYASS